MEQLSAERRELNTAYSDAVDAVRQLLADGREMYALLVHTNTCVTLSPLSTVHGSHASSKVLDFFLENSRTWQVLENHFGPGKCWKLKLKVLESPGKYP